ncbi:MAG: 30S ribosomal protein S6 [Roseibacillus sp.]|jgi:small subunit ribosomal protein S6|nr:30S ribosomal protein S6 [Roseibacillus sp.]HAO95389.1 30S ribosomal protein S6 [Verrucomicrobiales bacterium]|tara:strand:- start:1147 stop:1434 length:288 start_codon:yes stop_codon:yes gene_type:complete
MDRKYEGLIVLNTKGKEDSVDDLVGAVAKEMEAEGAKLEEIKQLGRHKFAYNARHLDGGHYVNYIFQADSQQVQKIQGKLKLNAVVHLQHYQRLG